MITPDLQRLLPAAGNNPTLVSRHNGDAQRIIAATLVSIVKDLRS